MKPHKHAELIKAWADGAEIQFKSKEPFDDWQDCTDDPDWNETEGECYYRIKPEPKLDVVGYLLNWSSAKAQWSEFRVEQECEDGMPIRPQIKLIWDGETGELKSAEVLTNKEVLK